MANRFDRRLLLILAEKTKGDTREQVRRKTDFLQQLQPAGHFLDIGDFGLAGPRFQVVEGIVNKFVAVFSLPSRV